MGLKLTNNAVSRLASGISSGDLSLSVTPGTGALFPTLGAGDHFPATLVRASDSAVEIVKVTARSTDVFTIERAQENTTALAFSANDRIELRLTADTIANLPASATNAAASKATPVDADELTLVDSSASNVLKKLTWANLKATLKTYFDTLYQAVGSYRSTSDDVVLAAGKSVIFEGTTDDAFETTVTVTDPTADRTITFPDASINVAGTNATQTFTAPQRGTLTSDNDLSFDLNASNYFSCTPTAGGTLTFTNIAATQSGHILLTNNSNYAITAAATTKINANDLTAISSTGVYLLAYFSNGTNVYVVVSRSFA